MKIINFLLMILIELIKFFSSDNYFIFDLIEVVFVF